MSCYSRKAAFIGLLFAVWAATCIPHVFASTIAAGDDLQHAAFPSKICPWPPRSHARSSPDMSLTEGFHTWTYHSMHSIRLTFHRTALPAGKGVFCMRLLHSIGAADVDLDDAWGSDTFDSSDTTVPKQAAKGLDDLSAAPKAKAQNAPVKPKVSAALGTGSLTAVCNAAAKRCAPLTCAETCTPASSTMPLMHHCSNHCPQIMSAGCLLQNAQTQRCLELDTCGHRWACYGVANQPMHRGSWL